MNFPLHREFRLSSRKGQGIFCDADGAFVGSVALLERSGCSWSVREADEVSEELGKAYGLPVDASSKCGAFAAIARALNAGDIARAQIVTLFLELPDPPPLARTSFSQVENGNLAFMLDQAGVLKINNRHYPAKTPGGKGGQFAPKDSSEAQSEADTPAADQGGADPTDLTSPLDDPTRGSDPLSGDSAGRRAASGSVEAAEEAGERQIARTVSRAAVRDAALGAERDAIRIGTRRIFRAAAIEALKNVGKKLLLTEIPVVGLISDISTVYDVYRFVKEFEELREGIAAATRFVNQGAHTLRDLRVSQRLEVFSDYPAFLKQGASSLFELELEKRFGPAGDGMSYHHIIERSSGLPKNITESTENIVKIPDILHEAINGRYLQSVSTSNTMKLRDWLETQPASVQREWGIKVMREFGIIVGE